MRSVSTEDYEVPLNVLRTNGESIIRPLVAHERAGPDASSELLEPAFRPGKIIARVNLNCVAEPNKDGLESCCPLG